MPLPNLFAAIATVPEPGRRRAVSHVAGLVKSLNLSMERQQTDNWCWAAVSVSVRKFYGLEGPLTQCEHVARQFRRSTCCDDFSTCDERFILDPNIFSRFNGPFPFVTVQQQIDAGRIVTARITWVPTGMHYVCIDGYNVAGPEPVLSVKDSFNGPQSVPYGKLVASYLDAGKWTESYFS